MKWRWSKVVALEIILIWAVLMSIYPIPFDLQWLVSFVWIGACKLSHLIGETDGVIEAYEDDEE